MYYKKEHIHIPINDSLFYNKNSLWEIDLKMDSDQTHDCVWVANKHLRLPSELDRIDDAVSMIKIR